MAPESGPENAVRLACNSEIRVPFTEPVPDDCDRECTRELQGREQRVCSI